MGNLGSNMVGPEIVEPGHNTIIIIGCKGVIPTFQKSLSSCNHSRGLIGWPPRMSWIGAEGVWVGDLYKERGMKMASLSGLREALIF